MSASVERDTGTDKFHLTDLAQRTLKQSLVAIRAQRYVFHVTFVISSGQFSPWFFSSNFTVTGAAYIIVSHHMS